MAVMVPINQRIKSLAEKDVGKLSSDEGDFPTSFFADETREWTFSDYLAQQPASFFEPYMLDHRLLTLEYNALRDELGEGLSKKRKNNDVLIAQVAAALAASELLEHIHQREYLDTWQVVSDLQAEQAAYRLWLELQGYNFSSVNNLKKDLNKDDFWLRSKQIRGLHDTTNPFRLFIVRVRRVFVLMALVLQDAEHYGHWLAAVEQYTGPFFTYLAWIFFFPRLVANLAVVGKHLLIPGEKEGDLSWETRLRAQLSRRWTEITNDAAWFASGIVACFILVGPLMPVAIYLAFAMQCYDLVSSVLRALHEIPCLRELEKKYLDMRDDARERKAYDEVHSIDRYLVHLRKRMTRDEHLLYLGIGNFLGLCIAITMSLPFLVAISPIIPVVGAVLAVLITLITYFARESLRASIEPNGLNGKLSAKPEPQGKRQAEKQAKGSKNKPSFKGYGMFNHNEHRHNEGDRTRSLGHKKKSRYKSVPELDQQIIAFGI